MALFGLGTRSQQPNRLGSVQIGTSEYGVAKPIGWGSFKAPIKLLDYTDFSSKAVSQGGKGGSQVSSYAYYAATDMMVVKGPVGGFGNIYDAGGSSALIGATETFTIPGGGGTHAVQHGGSAYYYDEGVTYPQNYSVVANDFGSDGSVTLSGSHPAPFQKVETIGSTSPPVGPLQYTVDTSGNYRFNAADAGKVVTITYAYTNADTTNPTSDGTGHTDGFDARSPILRLALSVVLGTTPGTAWGYMLTKHPERALRYDGLARVFCESLSLGSSATVPSLSVEVLNGRLKAFGSGVEDCDPKAFLTDLLEDPEAGCNWPYLGDLTNYSNFCVANSLFMSPFLDSVRKTTEFVQEICDLSNAEPVWSGNQLKIVPYGDTTAVGYGRTFVPQTKPIYEIAEAEMLCKPGEEAVRLGWQNLADNYNRVQFEYTARNDNYNTALIHEQDSASIRTNGLLPMKTISAHHYCVQYYAAVAMNMLLRRKSTPLRTYEFTLPWYFQLLEPMDIILLDLEVGGLGTTPVRIVSVEEQEDYSLLVSAEDFLFGVAEGIVFPKGGTVSNAPGAHDQPGNATVLAAFIPSTRVTGGTFELWVAMTGAASWGGCDVWLSLDGTNYGNAPIGRQYGSSRAGTLTSALPASSSDPDTANTPGVNVSGSLASVTQVEADGLATLSLVGTELISYETATLTGSTALTNAYNLSYLRRGIFSSGAQAHSAGERFVRLDDTLFKYVLDPSLAGRTVYLKFTSFNLYAQEEQGLSWVTPYTITLGAGGSAAASTMTVSSYANSGGTSATVSVNLLNGSPTASGSVTLPNGSTIALPPYSWPSEALNTWYGVNFDQTTGNYVLYTDQSLWLSAQSQLIAIGSTKTPAAGTGGGGSGSRYNPSAGTDSGTRPTGNPTYAYDGDPATNAAVRGSCKIFFSPTAATTTDGIFMVSGFPPVVLSAAATLYVKFATSQTDETIPCTVTANIAGTSTDLFASSSSTTVGTVTIVVPAGTNLSAVSVSFYATGSESSNQGPLIPGDGNAFQYAYLNVYDVYIQ
ncbi:MAG: phage tail protein [Acidobacteriota bacterium]|nr:phage tail protein [Acidobacteriota bacterium]